jgi:hypothetical protein
MKAAAIVVQRKSNLDFLSVSWLWFSCGVARLTEIAHKKDKKRKKTDSSAHSFKPASRGEHARTKEKNRGKFISAPIIDFPSEKTLRRLSTQTLT